MLENGKIYLVKARCGKVWLFKNCIDRITGCNSALCLNDMYESNREGYVYGGTEIEYIKKQVRITLRFGIESLTIM